MTKEEFLSLIRTPDEVIHQRPEAISSLVKEFPYCQALRYFYLLQLHGQNHISYAQQLKLSSAYAPDRKRLHQLIHPELLMHDSVAWNENIALENEGMIDTSSEKKEVSSVDIVDIPTDETIGTSQNHPDEISEEIPFYSSVIPSPKAIEEETNEVQSDEDAISAEEIVIQRLKELNIWTEPEVEQLASRASASGGQSEIQSENDSENDSESEILKLKQSEILQDEELLASRASASLIQSRLLSGEKERESEELLASRASASLIQSEKERESEELLASRASASEENILVPHGMIEENVDSDLEAEIEELEYLSTKQEEEEIKVETKSSSKEKELDPIEELILENIVTSQVNSSDYFSEGAPNEIAAIEISEDEHPSVGNSNDNYVPVKAITAPIEPIPHQPGEVHSFAEWLHLNQKSDSKIEEKVEESMKEVQTETPIPTAQPSPKTLEQVTIISEKETTSIPTAEVKNSREEIQIEAHAENAITDSAVNAPKMLYVKSTSPQQHIAPALHQKETIAPQSSPSLPAEKIPFSTISNTPLDTDPNLIPPKKPIPDPSLVDTDPPKSKVPADQLIDKFIKQEPRITPSKSAFYSPINMAKRSIIESDDIVSETLANIYAQQGNFQKAISFYTKLSLRFPEKSRYFAALIKELENKLNT
ncbi:MAG: hypothetical protein ACKVQV_09455 [Bacteroidia bacterium]